MRHTLVAAFDRATDAERARSALMSRGIAEDHIHEAGAETAEFHDYDDSAEYGSSADTERRETDHESKVSRFFKSLFGDDTENRRYADTYPEAVRRGSSVIAVDVDDDEEMNRAIDALESNGAIDIDERSATWAGSGTASGETPPLGDTEGGGRTIPVMEEELKIGKREASAGRVRVVSHIHERPVEERVQLREQHADIERRPVNREATPEELSGMREESFEVRETREEPVVQKTAKVVEEVQVNQDTTTRDETIRDSVRKTDVDIERDDDSRLH